MNILITGNLGYLGPILTKNIKKLNKDINITGFDIGYFANCITYKNILHDVHLNKQIYADIRNISKSDLVNIDAVVHLAALSNDPIGSRFESLTEEINYKASCNLIDLVSEMGIKNFVFASSCSVYGAGGNTAKNENDLVAPITSYAKSKINFENYLNRFDNIKITKLRFATACGGSSKMRLDLVLNDFVYSALKDNEINIKSDGLPLRPMIDVEDMSKAIIWSLQREYTIANHNLTLNVGSNSNNFKIIELAEIVKSIVKNTTININKNAVSDKRSYKVDFSLFNKITNGSIKFNSIETTIINLVDFYDKNFEPISIINNSINKYKRLEVLVNYIENNVLTENLQWNFG